LHRIKEMQIACTPIFVPQPRDHVLQNRKCPTAFVDFIGCEPVALFNIEALALTNLIQWNDPFFFSSLDRHDTTPFVSEKVLERCKQVRTESPFLLADVIRSLRSNSSAKNPWVRSSASSGPIFCRCTKV